MRNAASWPHVLVTISLLLPAITQAGGAYQGPMLVGVLEEVPGVYVGEASHFGVRVLFRQDADGWDPFPHECSAIDCLVSITSKYPQHIQWMISFDGRCLGVINTHSPNDFHFYSQTGIEDLDTGQTVPSVGGKSVVYSGYQETPIHRPLLATTGPREPTVSQSGWKPGVADPADHGRVWPLFIHLVPMIDDCRLDAEGEYIPSEGRVARPDEFEIASTWTDRSGRALIDARIRPTAFAACDGPPVHPSEYWFYREPTGKVWPLPGQGNVRGGLIMPIDFAVLTANGTDVALFLMAGDNAGGYALFYDEFRRVAQFTWLYH